MKQPCPMPAFLAQDPLFTHFFFTHVILSSLRFFI
jgi:hypothetical protein